MANRIKAVRRTCANCRFCHPQKQYCNRFRSRLKKNEPCTGHHFNDVALNVVDDYIKNVMQKEYHG